MPTTSNNIIVVTGSLSILRDADYISGSDLHTLNILDGLELRGFKATLVVIVPGSEKSDLKVATLANRRAFIVSHSYFSQSDEEFTAQITSVFRNSFVLLRQITSEHIPSIALFRRVGVKRIMLQIVDAGLLCIRGILVTGRGSRCQGPVSDHDCIRCAFSHRNMTLNLAAGIAFRWNMVVPSKLWLGSRMFKWAKSRAAENTASRELLRLCDILAFQSEAMRGVFISNGVEFRKTTITITGTKSSNPILPGKRPNPKTNLVVGYAGQIESHKGFHLLFRAIQRLNRLKQGSVKLVVASKQGGSGYNRAWFSRIRTCDWIEQLSYNGRDPKDVDKWHAMINVLCVPSVWIDNRPNVALEALARSTPIICPDFGCFPEIVRNGKTGYFFQGGNEESLFRLLKRLQEQPEMLTTRASSIKQSECSHLPTVDDEVNDLLAGFQCFSTSEDFDWDSGT